MKKEYMKPEAEMVKLVEEEDLMTDDIVSGPYTFGITDYTFEH